MITLLIANDEKLINDVTASVKASRCEIITYRWLLKALDNIVEINPDVIVINASDYPRHWKALCSFVNALHYNKILTKTPAFVLVTGPRFTAEDEEKGDILGVQQRYKTVNASEIGQFITELNPNADYIPSPVYNEPEAAATSESVSSAREDLSPAPEFTEPEAPAAPEKKVDEYQFVFTNPYNEVFVTGKVTNFDRNQITFIPDILTHTLQLSTGTSLKNCTISKNGEVKNIKAQVFSVADTAPYSLELYLEG